MKEHPKHENNMLGSSEHVKYIDSIGIDEILYCCIPLIYILKELQYIYEFKEAFTCLF